MKNNFTENTRILFIWVYSCGCCGKSRPLELHHILKRVSASPYNAFPICRKCHSEEPLHSFEVQSKFLKKTKKILDKQDYEPTTIDKEFLETYKKYYK